jgi:hypothetical protein
MIELQKKEVEERSTSMMWWSEYTSMSESYLKMKEKGTSERLVKNIGNQLKALEGKIGIAEEESIVEE